MDMKKIRQTKLAGWFKDKTLPSKEKSYISQLMSGKSSFGEKAARRLERDYGMPPGFLDSNEELQPDEIEFVGFIPNGMVKVVGEAFLGIDGAVDMIEALEGWIQIYSDDKDAYALKVKGDSMWPRIQSGEYVVVEPNTVVRSGDEVFVRTVEGKNMVKILNKTRDGSYQFTSVNNTHPPITVDPREVEKMHYVAAIVKPTKFIDKCEQS
ncbi:helix-turn-helix transcriptional regulator [Morganella morganii subsp. morganii]|uniref:Helix-turn-helix transcriptional regulator n=1 Tax=Morganella morganii TaxID=582 RepID=A0A9Q4GQC0_MORMO|nr:S24 family peptidase [Morganella morganii]EKW7747544.1 helix-turn-helix transcriptional regulator [Morganella morganii]ELA7709409.1 helix-turn-helix transcriptional regulator [Morganella morganii]ELT0454855.1 helix-turn-helix transcriptional regulator [Morganella morganii]MBT0337481.1 helix-turn-helix transcriptional regulator [Morganella morganii subsp. morganii]MBT0354615.1 helix-turn-helix transcriptional regulator [Morganella morganii subsp. morganii]